MKTDTLGRHILVEYYDCNREVLNNHKQIEEHMNNAAIEAKATIVKSIFHLFNPWGVSGAVVIQESHLTIHTWPEYGYAAVDLFTCGEDVNPWIAFNYLEKALDAKKVETLEVPRGIVNKIKNNTEEAFDKITYKPITQNVG